MPSSDDNHFSVGMDYFIHHPGREAEVSHYLRQTTITRRRQNPSINQVWYRNQRLTTKLSPWKH